MIGQSMRRMWWGAGMVAMALAACSQQGGQSGVASASQEEKTFTLMPESARVNASFLTGELQDMRVSERVEQGTGKVVDPPWLRGTLRLKNASPNQTARLIGGKIEYVDPDGTPIPVAKERGDTNFTFSAYQTNRLDPGMETSQVIEVPFPTVALEAKKLRDIRLELTFTPMPFMNETVNLPVALQR